MKPAEINMNNQPYNKNPDIKKNNKKRKNDKQVIYTTRDAVQQLRGMNNGAIPSDVMGSYTGTSHDGDSPEQDADDL